jgi:hypothetical protein
MNIETYYRRKKLNGSENNNYVRSVDFDKESKSIVSFCVLQLHIRDGQNYEIIKYDSSHGHCHVHKYYEELNDFGSPLLDNPVNDKSVQEFVNDIKQNWKEYLDRYCRKWFRHKF